MRVLIVYDHLGDDATPDQADALDQARAISAALEKLSHEWMTLGVTLDLGSARDAIARLAPDMIFNLVESLGGSGRLIHALPALLDQMGVPYTGATAEMQFITSHKPLAKRLMTAAGIPTPEHHTMQSLRALIGQRATSYSADAQPPTWIIKSLWEHASVGLAADSVISDDDPAAILRELESRLERLGGEGFAERYIDGREFNIALLASGDDAPPLILPPAEIAFRCIDKWGARPRIVNYDCKWNEQSFEYRHTERVFDFPAGDAPLLKRLREIALRCWQDFDLRGYARVDFRVDAEHRPWVLEVNTNPCLSPDAGFAFALERGGVSYAHAIQRIIDDARRLTPADVR